MNIVWISIEKRDSEFIRHADFESMWNIVGGEFVYEKECK